jgi:hypothetical protein
MSAVLTVQDEHTSVRTSMNLDLEQEAKRGKREHRRTYSRSRMLRSSGSRGSSQRRLQKSQLPAVLPCARVESGAVQWEYMPGARSM